MGWVRFSEPRHEHPSSSAKRSRKAAITLGPPGANGPGVDELTCAPWPAFKRHCFLVSFRDGDMQFLTCQIGAVNEDLPQGGPEA